MTKMSSKSETPLYDARNNNNCIGSVSDPTTRYTQLKTSEYRKFQILISFIALF